MVPQHLQLPELQQPEGQHAAEDQPWSNHHFLTAIWRNLGTWEPPVFTKKWMANMVKHEVLQQLNVDDG